MRRNFAGLPANIWTLLEAEDSELREPEWVPPAPAGKAADEHLQPDFVASSGRDEGVAYGGGNKARRKAARAAKEEAMLADVDFL